MWREIFNYSADICWRQNNRVWRPLLALDPRPEHEALDSETWEETDQAPMGEITTQNIYIPHFTQAGM